MSAKLTPYVVSAKAAGLACGVCGAKLREGDAAVSVWDPDALSWHQHAECQRAASDGASLAARLQNDIRAGKPPANPDPTHARRKVQGS